VFVNDLFVIVLGTSMLRTARKRTGFQKRLSSPVTCRDSMSSGRRVDWRAIPTRYRAWQALPRWRKLVWFVTRGLTVGLLYVAFAVGLLWYNEPALVEGIFAGREPLWAMATLLARRLELLGLLLILVPAVLAAVLLPHRPDWRG
jgi:hypothetical protein